MEIWIQGDNNTLQFNIAFSAFARLPLGHLEQHWQNCSCSFFCGFSSSSWTRLVASAAIDHLHHKYCQQRWEIRLKQLQQITIATTVDLRGYQRASWTPRSQIPAGTLLLLSEPPSSSHSIFHNLVCQQYVCNYIRRPNPPDKMHDKTKNSTDLRRDYIIRPNNVVESATWV